jgi:PBP1b-binding outer membrane lipoprotein LpoB
MNISTKLSRYVVMTMATVFLISCSSDDSSEAEQPQQTEQGFFYEENGTTPFLKADDTWVNGDYNSIIAQKQGSTVIEIVLTDLEEGTYDLSAPYAFTYVKGGYWEASAGTLTITKNEGNKLSGTFEATAGSGVTGVNSVEGEFHEIPIN